MKKTKKLSQKSKKTILAASVLGVGALIIGGTIAYSQDSSSMNNKFQLFSYRTLFTETFDPPSGWKTCETIDKTITVKNEYDEPVSVRLKLEEQWIATDGVTELPLVSATSGYQMAQINFAQNSGWTKQGDYYYYDIDLPKNGVTTTPITGVTLNCDANLDTQDPTADGVYSNAKYHLKITAQTIEAAGKGEWSNTITDMIEKKVNPDYTIDFTRKAIISNDTYTANGNGVDKYTEGGNDVYYYRGEVYDNNLIWANKCWKILRTTKTGGTKIIYNGEPTTVGGVRQCNATGTDSQITMNVNNYSKNTFTYNNGYYDSPVDSSYMYGDRYRASKANDARVSGAVLGNDVQYNSTTGEYTVVNTYTVNRWNREYQTIAQNYHYFCGYDGTGYDSTTCSSVKYLVHVTSSNSFAITLSGVRNIEELKERMFTNTNDSYAKQLVESWFENENLDGHTSGSYNYEDDLEDAVFCNDRSFYTGFLKSKDDTDIANDSSAGYRSLYSAYQRNVVKNASNNLDPSLDCDNQNDSFTKESANGNGKLGHKVGLITADESTMAGAGYYGYDESAFLYTGQGIWTITPGEFAGYGTNNASAFQYTFIQWDSTINPLLNMNSVSVESGLRPVVSLKAGTEISSGTGLKTDPFIIE